MADPDAEVDLLVGAHLPAQLRERLGRASQRVIVRDELPADGVQWQQALAEAEVLVGLPDYAPQTIADVLRSAPRLRWFAAGIAGAGEAIRAASEFVRIPDAVRVTRTQHVHDVPLAEFAILGLLAFRKDLPRLQADQHARRWPSRRAVQELSGATVLIVGLGGVGREVARLANALGMRVVGVNRSGGQVAHVDELHPPSALPVLAPRVDALVVTVPLNDATRGLIGAEVIDALPAEAVVVNVGRGAVVDEQALIEALRAGRLAGAALDVFATEPLPPASPLWDLGNVIVSPHTAALSDREDARFVDEVVKNLEAYVAGRPLEGVVDLKRGY